MSARQIRFSNSASDSASSAGLRPSRRQFFLALAPQALALASVLTACGKRGDLEPPPLDTERPTATEKDAVR